MRKMLRADLSGPVLAIIVTVAIIAAGLGVLAYFWYLAPTASKTPTLSIIGEPAILGNTLYMTVKNLGSQDVTVLKVAIGGQSFDVTMNPIQPGAEASIEVVLDQVTLTGNVVEGVLITTAGTYPFSAYIVG